MINSSNLPKVVQKKSKRVGRGQSSGRGKNSTKGHKGQTKHGGKVRVGFEGGQRTIMRRTPKFRGFRLKANDQLKSLSLSKINQHFQEGENVTLDALKAKDLISSHVKTVRIVNSGELLKKVNFDIDNGIYLTKGVQNVINYS